MTSITYIRHTRIFYFHNDGEAEVLCSNANWMNRNLLRRVETCFPIRDKKQARDVLKIGLRPYLADNVGAWSLRKDGQYYRVKSSSKERNAQKELMQIFGKL